jgi:hypothetical protein
MKGNFMKAGWKNANDFISPNQGLLIDGDLGLKVYFFYQRLKEGGLGEGLILMTYYCVFLILLLH